MYNYYASLYFNQINDKYDKITYVNKILLHNHKHNFEYYRRGCYSRDYLMLVKNGKHNGFWCDG